MNKRVIMDDVKLRKYGFNIDYTLKSLRFTSIADFDKVLYHNSLQYINNELFILRKYGQLLGESFYIVCDNIEREIQALKRFTIDWSAANDDINR